MDKQKIMVVDDDLDYLGVIKRILRAKGYDVATASSGKEAISRVNECFHNVAILDISLPDITGTELLTELLGKHPDMVAIMLTGHSSVQNAVESLNRGAFAYLEKPLAPDHLLSVISQGLEKQRLLLENRHLVEELERRNRETNILLTVSQTVAQSLDLEQIIGSALNTVTSSLNTEAGFVHLVEKGRLVLKGYHGLSKEVAEGIRCAAIDEGAIGLVFRQVKPFITDNLGGHVGSALAFLAGQGFQSYAGVPLTIMGESIGVAGGRYLHRAQLYRKGSGAAHRYRPRDIHCRAQCPVV
ncbi:MAG: response regulator [Dehalococcoidales bacterium]|nr:response regulator [Dehalococcoidales bacterium]